MTRALGTADEALCFKYRVNLRSKKDPGSHFFYGAWILYHSCARILAGTAGAAPPVFRRLFHPQ